MGGGFIATHIGGVKNSSSTSPVGSNFGGSVTFKTGLAERVIRPVSAITTRNTSGKKGERASESDGSPYLN